MPHSAPPRCAFNATKACGGCRCMRCAPDARGPDGAMAAARRGRFSRGRRDGAHVPLQPGGAGKQRRRHVGAQSFRPVAARARPILLGLHAQRPARAAWRAQGPPGGRGVGEAAAHDGDPGALLPCCNLPGCAADHTCCRSPCVQVREKVRAVKFLHNTNFFAAAQDKCATPACRLLKARFDALPRVHLVQICLHLRQAWPRGALPP